MAYDIKSSKLTGIPDKAGWSQVYEFKPDDAELLRNRGCLYSVVGTNKINEQIDSVLAGRQILSSLQKNYFEGNVGQGRGEYTSPSVLEILKRAVTDTYKEFSGWEGVQIGALVVLDEYIYLVSIGGVSIYLMRSGVFLPLLKSTDANTISASGIIKKDDVYLIATKSFFSQTSQGIIKALIGSKDLNSVSEYFAPIVHSSSNSGDMGMLLISFEEVEKTEHKQQIYVNNKPQEVSLEENQSHGVEEANNFKVNRVVIDKNKAIAFIKKLFEPKIYLNQEITDTASAKNRKMSATVGVLLLMMLFVSIFFGIRQKRINDARALYEKDLIEATRNIEEAESLISLNPDRSRELFIVSKGKVDSLLNQNIEDEELTNLENKIDSLQGTVLGEFDVSADTYAELNLLSDNFNGTDLRLTENTLYVFDQGARKIIRHNLNNKHTELVAGPTKINDSAYAIASYLDNIYVFEGDGVYEVGKERKKVLDTSWSGGIIPYAYAGNLYILETSDSMIRRYSSGEGSFSEGKEWLAEEVTTSLSGASSMAIDGNIWVLADGKIYRFSAGNLRNYSPPKDFKDIKFSSLYTNETLEDVYLSDKVNSRILVFSKDGEFRVQYKSSSIKDITQFVVSKEKNKIILLNGNKLLSIELKE